MSIVFKKDDLKSRFLASSYPSDDLPFKLEQNQYVNSEVEHDMWFIENPITKDLTKRITLKLGPKNQ